MNTMNKTMAEVCTLASG